MAMIITEFGCDVEEVIGTESVGVVMENVEVVPLETEATDDPIINTMAVSQAETSIEANDATEYVVENVDDNVMIINNTSAVSSIESEEATEFVEEDVDGVFSQEDDETQLSNKLPSMKENVGDALSLEDDEAESFSEAEPLETEATNVTAISTCVEDNFDETQPEESVEHTEFSHAIEYVTLEHENGDEKQQFEHKDAPFMDQPKGDDDIDDGQGDARRVKLKLDERMYKDAILDEIHVKWASMIVHKEALNSMNLELTTARQILKSKRLQIDHIERVINKVKNAIAVEDIDKRVNKAERIIKDETLSTEDEKKFIREIKQLKIMRLQLASNIVSPNEIHQKDQLEKHLKDLNMELNTLKDEVIKARVSRNTLSKKYDEERDMERELWARFIAAEDSCNEESSAHLYSLDKLLNEEVERYMDEWDTDEEFGRYNMLAINLGPTVDEVKSMLEVTGLETQKTVESAEEEQSGDQINENVLEEVEPITKTEETNELTKEEIEAMEEKIRLDGERGENKAQEKKKRNALKAQKRAEKRAQKETQKEAQLQEKRKLRRLKKREKKRASLENKRALAVGDAASSNIKDEIVAQSNMSNEFEKQPKPEIKNKNQWTHRGNMIITFVVLVLWVFSFLHSTLQQKPIAGPQRKTYIF